MKSAIAVEDTLQVNALGRSYYCFCLEQALAAIKQARQLVAGDRVEHDHELPLIEKKITEALEAA